jgi:hypothetical protein
MVTVWVGVHDTGIVSNAGLHRDGWVFAVAAGSCWSFRTDLLINHLLP